MLASPAGLAVDEPWFLVASTLSSRQNRYHIWCALRAGSCLDFSSTRAFTLPVPSRGRSLQVTAVRHERGEVVRAVTPLLRSVRRWLSSLRPEHGVHGESPSGTPLTTPHVV